MESKTECEFIGLLKTKVIQTLDLWKVFIKPYRLSPEDLQKSNKTFRPPPPFITGGR